MVGPAVLAAIVQSAARRCQARYQEGSRRSFAPAVPDRLATMQSATGQAAWKRPRPNAENFYGEEVSSRPLSGMLTTADVTAASALGTATPKTPSGTSR